MSSQPKCLAGTPAATSGQSLSSVTPHGAVRGHVVIAVNALRGRLAEPWTLNGLADEVHLSRSQLVRAFHATVGMSPMAYLRRMRIERMAGLLVSTDLSVAEAAHAVGWRNQFHASQCFHAHYGVSPTEFRRHPPRPRAGLSILLAHDGAPGTLLVGWQDSAGDDRDANRGSGSSVPAGRCTT